MRIANLLLQAVRKDLGNFTNQILTKFASNSIEDQDIRHAAGQFSAYQTVLTILHDYENQLKGGQSPHAEGPSAEEANAPKVQTVSLDAAPAEGDVA